MLETREDAAEDNAGRGSGGQPSEVPFISLHEVTIPRDRDRTIPVADSRGRGERVGFVNDDGADGPRVMKRIRALLATNPLVVDTGIALVLAVLSVLAYASGSFPIGQPAPIAVTLLLLETLPLALRRRFPLVVFLIVVGATAVHIALVPAGEELPGGLPVLVALYTVGESLNRRTSLSLLMLTGLTVAGLMLAKGPMPDVIQPLIQSLLVIGVAWLLGDAAGIRGLYTAAVEERASMLERERTERARMAVLEERERIARELHDAVAHHVSVVVIQAGAGLRALDSRPEDARAALDAIDASGRQALTDMRRMLAMLAETTDEPLPGLDRLGDLLEQVRAAGLSVELSIHGRRPALLPELEASAYRIIQESLTNSLKHAGGGGRAHVTIRYEPTAVSVSVDDQRGAGVAAPVEPAHPGRGLTGMRERVALFRGTFAAEPTATGFRVSAEHPLGDAK
jgi:signal transduction histidine kinase